MVKELMHDQIFLAGKSEPATSGDLSFKIQTRNDKNL